MRSTLLVLSFFLLFIKVQASHIVGGELVFKKLTGNNLATHQLGLNLYFDQINGIPAAEDNSVTLFIFRKADNRRVGSVQVPKVGRKNISYANPLCGNSGLRTLLITYSVDVALKPEDFSDPEGYYIVWDRCCRNNVIDNIRTPGDVGSLFQVFFPPLIKNAAVFDNSAPEFTEIKGDYACLNADFYIDFSATDADGDSLVYQLTPPVTGFSNRAVPNPQALGSSNYPIVSWVEGISMANVIPGSKPLRVDPVTGRVSFNASKLGLFAFAITVTEFRNGEKIGAITRDFQLKVIDCFEVLPPEIIVVESENRTRYFTNDSIQISVDDPTCFTIQVTDPNFNQLLRIKGRAVNAPTNNFSLFPTEFRTRKSRDTLSFQICLDDCFASSGNRPVKIELIVEDESCPVPLTDTLNLYIFRKAAPNEVPLVTTTSPQSLIEAFPDERILFDVLGSDSDSDSILLSAQGRGFLLSEYGINFPQKSGVGSVSQPFSWLPPCSLKVSDTLMVDFIITDLRCGGGGLSSRTTIKFVVQNPINIPPSVQSTAANDTIVWLLGEPLNERIFFDVLASDPDSAQLSLFALGRDFDLGSEKMNFLNKLGFNQLTSSFEWIPTCESLKGLPERYFTLDFICEDQSCLAERDTISVTVLVKDQLSDAILNLPNVLTPNSDGKNDCLDLSVLPPNNCIEQFIGIKIFNRWGTKVFESTDLSQTWCPNELPMGSYFYHLSYTKRTVKGSIVIIK
ncbi:T9SS type B sorting domain-containing protein [Arundinibacter roseus]|uniref:Gliding motility-associated C-terminal domain-containing protein n=1 Tax=Arundinibacter roseus TaxID=2070510 RepID=A0A4R4KG24_9BACT|nr:gliding motility-associated C-terminal domain-containing protein [Arundinibacter roseus]TDB66980.1 gliding motility-associated C-terminal domain-containing protein [Arundinibacter roseus]